MGRFTTHVQMLSDAQREQLARRIDELLARHQTRLVAYVVSRAGQVAEREDVIRFLEAELPAYMVPSMVVPLDAVPLTSTGKVDRQALPPPWSAPVVSRPGPPVGATEARLARIWCSVLGLTDVGREDDFFADLGGHSLLATRLLSAVRESLGVDLPLRTLFEAPTIAGLAQQVEMTDATGSSEAQPIPRLPRRAYGSDLDRDESD